MSRAALIFRFLLRRTGNVFLIGVALLLTGEVILRLPIGRALEYQPDQDLGAVLRPNQRAGSWMGEMTYLSPPITLNADGHRGPETDWPQPALLTLGDSE